MWKRPTILLSAAGLLTAIFVVATAKENRPRPAPEQPPSVNPYTAGIAAIGVVEPASRAVAVAAPEAGRVVEVYAMVNQDVEAGDPLFRLDGVPLEADVLRAEAALAVALAEVRRAESWPRPEDFPPAEAEVTEARARLADAEQRLANVTAARVSGGASEDELSRQRWLVESLRAALAAAEARLARLRSGTWTEDLTVARAIAAAREVDLAALRLRLDRLTVRSPLAGRVLRRNVEPGEFARSDDAGTRAPFVVGDLSRLHVRALVDEEDTPLLREGAGATARVRGPIDTHIPLRMLRIEPIAVPKTQLSNASTELVDTRVVEVVFEAAPTPGSPTLYSGQVVDVYIESAAR